jgi:uncharacterized pyridoxamine 5'-phosphate oxidase family protein
MDKPKALQLAAYEFICTNRAGSLATVGDNITPHVATVYCLVNEDLSLYFMTRVEARKYQNLIVNPKVALSFMNESDMETIQLTGVATRVDSLEKEQDIMFRLFTLRSIEQTWQIPPVQLFESGATNGLAVVRVEPSEMVYASFTPQKNGRYKPFFQTVIPSNATT